MGGAPAAFRLAGWLIAKKRVAIPDVARRQGCPMDNYTDACATLFHALRAEGVAFLRAFAALVHGNS